jgi:ribulose-phosphate 3-epimerase
MPLNMLEELLHEIDYAIIMSVNPGFGGQSFIPGSFERVRRLREMIDRLDLTVQIEIDGGIDSGNIQAAAEAGVDVAVAGSAVFKAPDPAQAVRDLLAKVRG